MSATESTMMPLGTRAPEFNLRDTVSGEMISLEGIRSNVATVVMFICNHCPYVIHVRHELARLANDYMPRGVAFVGISSNDPVAYPIDAPERMKEEAELVGYNFPYLFDETQDVARAYGAACTPEFYIFDRDLACVYRGQLDGSRPSNDTPVTGRNVRAALDAILCGAPVNPEQKASIGCSIKWRRAS